jgi:hypothetical protein
MVTDYMAGQPRVMSANPNRPDAKPAIKNVPLKIIPSAADQLPQSQRATAISRLDSA